MRSAKDDTKTVATYCKQCGGHRVIDVKGVCETTPIHEGEPLDEFVEVTVLGVCTGCGQPVVAQNWASNYDPNEAGSEYHTLFPRDNEDQRALSFEVPRQISVPYYEAVKCEKSKAWNACVVMVGKALEAAAKDYDSRARTIASGLERMHTAGAISDELFEWANELRVLRNIGAHATSTSIEEPDAKESLDFLQAILETIYHLRPMFKRMKERTKTKSNKQAA